MNYSDKEKMAIVKILFAIIHADGYIDSTEVDYMALVEYELGLDHEFMKKSVNIEYSEAFDTVSAMDERKKSGVVKMIHNMLNTDRSKPTEEELIVLAKILRYCDIEQ